MSNICEISLDNLISEKMEENLMDIQKYRNVLMHIKNLEQFFLERNKIVQGLFNIEDDIRETYQLAKSTLIVNKEINEQVEDEIDKNKDLSSRLYSLEKVLENMQEELRSAVSISEYYKEKDADNTSYIKDLEKRLLKLKRSGKEKEYEFDYDNEFARSSILPVSDYVSNSGVNDGKFNEDEKSYSQMHNPTQDNANKIIYDRLNEKNVINSYFNADIPRNEHTEKSDEIPVKEVKTSEILQNDENIKPSSTSKANRVMDIIMKLNSFDDIYSILKRLFGEDIEQRLSSSDVDEKFISQVEDSIKEIEELKRQEETFSVENNSNNVAEIEADNSNQNKQVNSDQPCRSPNWTETNNAKINYYNEAKHDDISDDRSNTRLHNINSYDSIINYLPKRFVHDQEYRAYDYNYDTGSRFKDTFSSRRFSPPKKYDNYEDSHLTICRNKSNSKSKPKNYTNRNMYSDIGSMNRAIADKILISNRNEESNFENSLRNYLKKGGKSSKNDRRRIFKNHTSSYGNFFDPSLQKGGRSNISAMNKSK